MLIASMNPCPCGYYNHPTKACVCSPGQVQKYLNKISGPLLDRIDIQIEIVPVPFDKISDQRQGESSNIIRQRVIKARQMQERRYTEYTGIYCNAQMNSKLLAMYAQPDAKGLALLKNAMERLNFKSCPYNRRFGRSRTNTPQSFGRGYQLSESRQRELGWIITMNINIRELFHR